MDDNQTAEDWQPIPGAEIYEASSLGRIRRRGKVLRQRPDQNGYWRVTICIKNKMLGHSDVRITQEVYGVVDVEHLRGAVERLKRR